MITPKQSRVINDIAELVYDFLPGSGAPHWKGHVSYETVAEDVGVGRHWRGGSKKPAIAKLLERTLNHRPGKFEPLILAIVKEGLRYRDKKGSPVKREEIEQLNGFLLELDFQFPSLWDEGFLASLELERTERATKKVDKARKEDQAKQSEREGELLTLDSLRQEFQELSGMENRQEAGRRLEPLLNKIFTLSKLNPREPFRVTGEQIDGAFEFKNEIYLLEAKWEASKLSAQPLYAFRQKIETKSQFTRGAFFALNGCTDEALDALVTGQQSNFFIVDGFDLMTVLLGEISLLTLFDFKLGRLAREGKPFASAMALRRESN